MLAVTRSVGDAPYRKQSYSTAPGGLRQETTPPPAVLSGLRSARRGGRPPPARPRPAGSEVPEESSRTQACMKDFHLLHEIISLAFCSRRSYIQTNG